MEFNQDKPIYRQITDWMSDKILRKEWGADERIPSVRDVAALLQVNPNTAMRAYEALQQEDVIYNKRGIGYFVAPDAYQNVKKRERSVFLSEVLPELFSRMELLGLSLSDLEQNRMNIKKVKDENEY